MTQPTLTPAPGAAARRREATPWWRRPWLFPLWIVSGGFIAWRAPAYLGLTPEDSIVELRDHTHYLLLSAHVVLGTVALVCCCLQLWPWLRQHHAKVHRVSGRIYVAVVVPGSVLAFVSAIWQQVPVTGKISNMALAVLWLLFTLTGFRLARKRQYAEHRRWMIRSFALCFSIVVNRLWTGVMIAALLPFADTVYAGDEFGMFMDAAVAAAWLSWTVNLVIAEWWIERCRRPRRRRADTPGVPVSGS